MKTVATRHKNIHRHTNHAYIVSHSKPLPLYEPGRVWYTVSIAEKYRISGSP